MDIVSNGATGGGGVRESALRRLFPLSPPFRVRRPTPARPLTQAEQDDCIAEMVERLVADFAPRRICLFGSRARGDHRPDSDVDLLVEVDGDPDDFELGVGMRRRLSTSPLGKDIVVVGSDSWRERSESLADILHYVAGEAVPLHERA